MHFSLVDVCFLRVCSNTRRWTELWNLDQLAKGNDDFTHWRVIDVMHAVYHGICKDVLRLLVNKREKCTLQ